MSPCRTFHILSYVSAYDAFRPCRRLRTAGIVLILAAAALRSGGELAGELDVTMALDPSTETELTLELSIGNWIGRIETEFEDTSWDEQTFEAGWESGALEASSRLRFEPDRSRFKDWRIEATWTRGPAEIELERKLTRTRGWLTLDADWTTETIAIESRLRLRSIRPDAPLRFYDAELVCETALPNGEASIEVEIDVDGFDAATLDLSDLVFPYAPYLAIDVEVERTIAGTAIEITPELADGGAACVEVAFSVGGAVDFVRLEAVEVAGGFAAVDAEGTMLFDPDEWIDDTYAGRAELAIVTAAPSGRETEVTLEFLWEGGAHGRLLPSRAVPSLRLELGGDRSLEIELDLLLRTGTLAGIDCTLEW